MKSVALQYPSVTY